MKGIGKRILAVLISAVICLVVYVPASAATSLGFNYEVISGSTSIRITGYNGLSANVLIPDTLDGRTVVEIGSGSFSSHTGIRSVTISSNVERIMKEAFSNCSSLESVTVPASVSSIGASAFSHCVSLETINIMSASTAIGHYAFEGCSALESVTIPSTKIGSAAFRDCSSLETIRLLDSVQSVGRYAFDSTAWYKAQPQGLVTLGNVVYKYTGEETDVVIPDGIRCIAEYAFYETKAESVVLPEGLYYIDNFAFANCSNLKYLSVPSSVISIGTKAIGYSGNNAVSDFTVYCYDESTAKDWAENNSLNVELIDNCEHEYSDWTVIEQPDCLTEGSQFRRCVKCNIRETANAEPTGHSWSGWITISELTCTVDGIKKRTCTSCGETEEDITLTTGHSWGEWSYSKRPDCENEGEGKHTCTVCGTESVETIPATGHTWIVNENTDSDGWNIAVEPTCSEEGAKFRTCSVCEAEKIEILEKKPHISNEWTVIKDPTPVTTGVKKGICSVCGEEFNAEIPVVSETLPDNVKELTLVSNATIRFDSTGHYVYGVSAETKISEVLLQFKYPGHILVTDTKLNQPDNNSYMGTGCILALLKHDSQTDQYIPIDPACVIIKGDANGDGIITAADARLALQVSSQITTLQYPFFVAADLNEDSEITALEARKILRVASEIDTF